MTEQVQVHPTPEEVAKAFAVHFAEWAAESDKFTVALSGGSTPELVFQLMGWMYRDVLDWRKVHVFWGDERCVPPDHPESNFRMANELLLKHVPIPAGNIHRIMGENAPELEAVRYADEIKEHVTCTAGWPVFDLVMLGIGTDGHTASIFPDQMALLKSENVCAVATHPETGQQRITLTGQAIIHARRVAFLVTGGSKRKIVRAIRERKDDWDTYPASYILPKGALCWFLDEAAV